MVASRCTLATIDAAIDTLRGLGAEISEVTLSPMAEWHACGTLISLTERAAAYEEWARTRGVLPPNANADKITHLTFGWLPASLLVRRWDGITWAILFNADADQDGKYLGGLIDPLVHPVADGIKDWPAGREFRDGPAD